MHWLVPATHVLDLLTDLVEQSLIRTQPDLGDAVRFGMLETIREYGGELLQATGEAETARQSHLSWCLLLAEKADPLLLSAEQEHWQARLRIEHDNLRAALGGAITHGDIEPALRLCAALYRFWANDGRYEEGRQWLERVIERAPSDPTAPRGHALIGLGVMLFFQGDYQAAASTWEQALQVFHEVGDVRGMAYAHGNLGLVADVTADYPRALAEYEAALELFRELDDRTYISFMTHNSGLIAYFQGDYKRARTLFTESLTMVEDENSRALTLGNLSLVALAEGRLDQALALQRDAFANWRHVTNLPWLARGLEHFALIAIATGDLAHGVRLFGAAAAERARIGGTQPDNDRAINERYIARAQDGLGGSEFAPLGGGRDAAPQRCGRPCPAVGSCSDRSPRSPGAPSRMPAPVSPLLSGFDSPEGPCFDTAGNLYFVNWLSSSIMRRTPDGEVSEFFNTGGIPAGLAFHADGSLYVADEGDNIHGILRIVDGQGEILVNSYQGQPLNGANDLVFDANGVLYFSDPWRSSAANPVGGFYRLFPDSTLEQIDTGLQFPNGVALSPSEDAVYLAETIPNRILRYAIAHDGAIGPREHWADMPPVSFPGAGGTDDDLPTGGPDGMAFDEAGNLYVAYYGGSRVVIFAPDSSLAGEILMPGANVTNIAFGGQDRRTAVITDVATASVYSTQVDTPGLRLFSGV